MLRFLIILLSLFTSVKKFVFIIRSEFKNLLEKLKLFIALNPNLPHLVFFFINGVGLSISFILCLADLLMHQVALAEEIKSDTNNLDDVNLHNVEKKVDVVLVENKPKPESFIRTSEDFFYMLHNFHDIKDKIDPKFSEEIVIFERFLDKISVAHDLEWFFKMYSDTDWFRSWSNSIMAKPFFYEFILSDFYLRELFEDIIPIEIRSEVYFWSVCKETYWSKNGILQSQEFSDFVSKFNLSEKELEDLNNFRQNCLKLSEFDQELRKFLSVKENFDNYTKSFPEELHADVWAIRKLREFELFYTKDPEFFSIFKDNISYESRLDYGQNIILHPKYVDILTPREIVTRMTFLRTLENYSGYFPVELRNLIVNCHEINNLRNFCALHPDKMYILKDLFSDEVFEKLIEWRSNYVPRRLFEADAPKICPPPGFSNKDI